MSNKPSQFIILCEDKLQESVIRRFLKKGWDIQERLIRRSHYPNGAGSGEQHVRNKYANELRAYRSRSASTVLLVVIDADTKSVEAHHAELDAAARSNGILPRSADESIIHVIPKHHIETWLAYLNGAGNIDETCSYKKEYGFKNRESEAHRLVDKLTEICKNTKSLEDPPDSLKKTCVEFNKRIRSRL